MNWAIMPLLSKPTDRNYSGLLKLNFAKGYFSTILVTKLLYSGKCWWEKFLMNSVGNHQSFLPKTYGIFNICTLFTPNHQTILPQMF